MQLPHWPLCRKYFFQKNWNMASALHFRPQTFSFTPAPCHFLKPANQTQQEINILWNCTCGTFWFWFCWSHLCASNTSFCSGFLLLFRHPGNMRSVISFDVPRTQLLTHHRAIHAAVYSTRLLSQRKRREISEYAARLHAGPGLDSRSCATTCK